MRKTVNIKKHNKTKNDISAYFYLLPVFVLLLVFGFYPPIKGLFYAFTDYSGGETFNFVWFDNFIELFKDEQYHIFYRSLLNMVILIALGIITGNLMTFVFSELLFNLDWKKTSSVFRFIFILPALVPSVVVTLVWTKIIFLPSSSGLMNRILAVFGAPPSQWYYSSDTSLISLWLTGFPWVGGTSFLIYLAGLQNINESIFDAANIDGCKGLKKIFYIDLPLIKGQIKYFLVLGVIQGLQNFSMQVILNQDITNKGIVVPAYYMYSMAFTKGSRFGYASAIGVIIFVLALIMTIINNKFINTEED